MVITSPNMDYVPEYPVEASAVIPYNDGRWGLHEYSHWPQDLVNGMWHIACIPIQAAPPDLPPVLWETFLPDTHWVEDRSIGFGGIGYIEGTTRDALLSASQATIRRFEAMNAPEIIKRYGCLLVGILRRAVDRLCYLPVVPRVAITVATLVQRVCLELAGLKTYTEVVLGRLASDRDCSMDVLPVIGAFVREASNAQICTRLGLPTWFIRPFTHELVVWKVAECRSLPSFIHSGSPSGPPIFHEPRRLTGIPTLTCNRLTSILLFASEQVASTHLERLSPADAPADISEPLSKRPRLDGQGILKMSPPDLSGSRPSKSAKRCHNCNQGQGVVKICQSCPRSLVIRQSRKDETSPSLSDRTLHSSKSFTPSPFYDVSSVWASALRDVSPVPRTPNSAKYFYPPPFLLDTVSSVAGLPRPCQHPEYARSDEKVHRYLHNLVRIREFCRVRMFDGTIDKEPLTIAEWRAALWGDYEVPIATKGPSAARTPADHRRSARRLEERKGVSRLFGRVGRLRSYRGDETIQFLGIPVDLQAVAQNPHIRLRLLWEAHEVNFRAELLSLDAVVVKTHSPSFPLPQRIERELRVSTIWGPPSSIMEIFPHADDEDQTFRWHSPPDVRFRASMDTLQNFIAVLAAWPGCPQSLVHGLSDDVPAKEFAQMQKLAVAFYVQTFVKMYARLPIPPICFPFGTP